MQTNLLLNVLATMPGLAGQTPPSNPLLGTAAGTVAGGNLPGNTIGGQFAGLLGQPGKQSDLTLLDINNPTGDIETSPQVLDIAPPGVQLAGQNLPTLATYIDAPINPAMKNQLNIQADGNTIDSKKATVASQLASLNKANISKDSAQVASDVVNELDFQNAIKNIEAQKPAEIKPAEGKINLAELPADMKAATLTPEETQDIMTKVAAQLTDTNKVTAQKTSDAVATQANSVQVAAKEVTPADASNAGGEGELSGKLKTEATKVEVKTADKDSAFKIDTASTDAPAPANHAQEVIKHIKDIKIDVKTAEIAQGAVNQVEVKIAQMVKDGVDMVRIKLHPEDLGKIDIQMDVDSNGRTAIRIVADKVETLEMLRKDSSSLERALKDTGVKTDSAGMQFSLRDQNNGQQQQNFAAWEHANTHSYAKAQVNDNYLKAANVTEYTLTMNPQIDGLNILA